MQSSVFERCWEQHDRRAHFQKTCTHAVLRRLATFDGDACRVLEDGLKQYPDTLYRSLAVRDILEIACELPADHPGWSLLALLAEHAKPWQQEYRDLGRLKRRMEAGEFTELHFVVIVWIECRKRSWVPPSEDMTFPPHWKDIMLRTVEKRAVSNCCGLAFKNE